MRIIGDLIYPETPEVFLVYKMEVYYKVYIQAGETRIPAAMSKYQYKKVDGRVSLECDFWTKYFPDKLQKPKTVMRILTVTPTEEEVDCDEKVHLKLKLTRVGSCHLVNGSVYINMSGIIVSDNSRKVIIQFFAKDALARKLSVAGPGDIYTIHGRIYKKKMPLKIAAVSAEKEV